MTIAAVTRIPNNHLLRALPKSERERVLAGCDTVQLEFGQALIEFDAKCRYVYFPTTGFVSLIATLGDKSRMEVGMVGDEGMLGVSLVLGVNISPLDGVVQGEGVALRMNAAAFARELARGPVLQRNLNRYTFALMQQLAQTAACNHYHQIEARLARWLLMSRDRAHSSHFRLTHEFLAYMLGVRRVGITKAASALERRGLIEYKRGNIHILNESALESVCCTCYRQGNDMYTRLLGKRRAAPASH